MIYYICIVMMCYAIVWYIILIYYTIVTMIHSIAMVYVYIVCLLFDIDYVFFSIPISLICEKYNGGIILYEVISD